MRSGNSAVPSAHPSDADGRGVPGRSRAAELLGLTPDIVAVSTAIFVMGLGENLWRRFLPKYLESFGAPITAIGLFGTAEDFLDGVYQYPGGWVADRYGRRRALIIFVSLTAAGYVLFTLMPAWPLAFAALALVMAWDAMASPTLFAVVGDALPSEKRTMGFTVQSILRRVPIILAPTLGGLAIAYFGLRSGVQLGLVASIALAMLTLAVVSRVRIPVVPDDSPMHIGHVWRVFPRQLRWLLTSDVFIRTCDAMVDVFLVLYAVNVIQISMTRFGILIAVQAATAMLVYFPAARIAERTGKKPFVVATFAAFALFPLAVVQASSFATLVVAFVVGGLREIGEPARKALIIDLAVPSLRARTVGLYYLGRSFAIAPAAFAGGLLWHASPALPFYVAAVIGLLGTLVFIRTVDAEHAG
ncbi:MAG TPA: MFS transporter [Gemmatimonadaceae bacterium]|nr:MFS transporter [Gemmatimonadaceae bacterium]